MNRTVQFIEPDDPNAEPRISNAATPVPMPAGYVRRAIDAIADVLPKRSSAEDKAEKAQARRAQAVNEADLKEITPVIEAHAQAAKVFAETRHELEAVLGACNSRGPFCKDKYTSSLISNAVWPVLEQAAIDVQPVNPTGYVETRDDIKERRDYWRARRYAAFKGNGK